MLALPLSPRVVLFGGLAALTPWFASRLPAQTVPTARGAVPRDFVHEVWTMEDGLPISHLTGVTRTGDGYLWLSSYDGLIRFDGVEFSVFTTTTNPELPTNRFRQVVEGPEGDVWAVADYDHVVRWRRGTFEVYGIGQQFQGTPVQELVFDEASTPWVSSGRGAFVLEDGSLELFQGFEPPGLSPVFFLGKDGRVWYGTNAGGAFLVGRDRVVRVGGGEDVRSRWAGAFADGPDGVTYIGTGDAVIEYRDGATRSLLPPGIDRLYVRALEPLGGDTTLVVSDLGVYTLHGGVMALLDGEIRATSSTPVGFVTSPEGTAGSRSRRGVSIGTEISFSKPASRFSGWRSTGRVASGLPATGSTASSRRCFEPTAIPKEPSTMSIPSSRTRPAGSGWDR